MCSSGAGRAINKNPILNVGSESPALVKIGGEGESIVSVGTKGPGIVKLGGEGKALVGATKDPSFLFLGGSGLRSKNNGPSPPGVDEPPSRQGRSQELAIQQATAEQRRRLALLGFRRFVLTSGRGVTSQATLGRKALLGR